MMKYLITENGIEQIDLISMPPLLPLDGRVLAYFKNNNFQN